MAKSGKEHKEDSRARKREAGLVSFEAVVSLVARDRLDTMKREAGLDSRSAVLELLIEHGTLPAPSMIEARKLLAECGGNHDDAMEQYKLRVKEQPERYQGVRDQLYNLQRKKNKGLDQSTQEPVTA